MGSVQEPSAKPGVERSPSKSKLGSHLKVLLSVSKKFPNHAEEIKELEQLLQDKTKLQEELQVKTKELRLKEEVIESLRTFKDKEIAVIQAEKEREITELQLKKDALYQEFSKQYGAWRTNTDREEQLEAQVAELQAKLSLAVERAESAENQLIYTQQQSQRDKHVMEETGRQLELVSRTLSSRENELQGTKMNLDLCEKTLQRERNELGLIDLDMDDLAIRFADLTTKYHDLAREFFLTHLPENMSWTRIWMALCQSKSTKEALRKRPLSDSVASQYVRMAVAEKVMAEKLCEHIFVPFYLPADRIVLEEALNNLYEDSPREEAIFRMRLLSAFKPLEQQRRIETIVQSTLAEIVTLLEPLLFTPEMKDEFQSNLERLLYQAVQLWRFVQRSPQRATIENAPSQDWDSFKDYDTAIALQPDEAKHIPEQTEAILALFPQVSIGEELICPGYALWTAQSTVVASDIEYLHSAPRSSTSRTNSFHGNLTRWDSTRSKLSRSTTVAVASSADVSPVSPKAGLTGQYFDRRISLPKGMGERTVSAS
ncbi:hypothetical protein F5884DRAFT_314917 [Xylogone sp. PMI_703]|nr:hypothetical protein F5884DRAFT_314917 [Xylogone sp. PMI_703]